MSDKRLEELRRKVTTSGASVGPLWRNEAKELIVELDRLRTEYAKTKRGAHTLGQIIEAQCRDALNATGLHHLIDESGDGDWGAVWENLAELGECARRAEAALARLTDDSMAERIAATMSASWTDHGEHTDSPAAILAMLRAFVSDQHDDQCEAEYVTGATGYTMCGCAIRAVAAGEQTEGGDR